ncbi:MAG: 3-deoxy-manno-octulosonate cytidylyltransferase [Lachnospiraceae bacterium]|nr:3-deoxy-manno-octulosonate cytidylyltransferase [Lachnospiraceae bacterium]
MKGCVYLKIIAIIPARYNSTRLPGKPLVDICGKPMIYRVYDQVKKMNIFDDVICAIDSIEIEHVCKNNNIKYVFTSKEHPNHISRVHEVSSRIDADWYVCINGDEPLISKECVEPVISNEIFNKPILFCAMRKMIEPSEVIDFSNIKVATNNEGRCIYMSRTPVPYPRGTLLFKYYKYVGVECFNKKALDFFVSKKMGKLEKIEDIDHLRFIENSMEIFFKEVQSESISVDTQKDLEKVRMLYEAKEQYE